MRGSRWLLVVGGAVALAGSERTQAEDAETKPTTRGTILLPVGDKIHGFLRGGETHALRVHLAKGDVWSFSVNSRKRGDPLLLHLSFLDPSGREINGDAGVVHAVDGRRVDVGPFKAPATGTYLVELSSQGWFSGDYWGTSSSRGSRTTVVRLPADGTAVSIDVAAGSTVRLRGASVLRDFSIATPETKKHVIAPNDPLVQAMRVGGLAVSETGTYQFAATASRGQATIEVTKPRWTSQTVEAPKLPLDPTLAKQFEWINGWREQSFREFDEALRMRALQTLQTLELDRGGPVAAIEQRNGASGRSSLFIGGDINYAGNVSNYIQAAPTTADLWTPPATPLPSQPLPTQPPGVPSTPVVVVDPSAGQTLDGVLFDIPSRAPIDITPVQPIFDPVRVAIRPGAGLGTPEVDDPLRAAAEAAEARSYAIAVKAEELRLYMLFLLDQGRLEEALALNDTIKSPAYEKAIEKEALRLVEMLQDAGRDEEAVVLKRKILAVIAGVELTAAGTPMRLTSAPQLPTLTCRGAIGTSAFSILGGIGGWRDVPWTHAMKIYPEDMEEALLPLASTADGADILAPRPGDPALSKRIKFAIMTMPDGDCIKRGEVQSLMQYFVDGHPVAGLLATGGDTLITWTVEGKGVVDDHEFTIDGSWSLLMHGSVGTRAQRFPCVLSGEEHYSADTTSESISMDRMELQPFIDTWFRPTGTVTFKMGSPEFGIYQTVTHTYRPTDGKRPDDTQFLTIDTKIITIDASTPEQGVETTDSYDYVFTCS